MLKMGWFGVVRGNARSLEIALFDRMCTLSYYPFTVNCVAV